MKKLNPLSLTLALLLVAAACFALGGCSTTPRSGEAPEFGKSVNDYAPAIKTAAMVGTHYVLRDNPELKPKFIEAANALEILANAPQIDFAQIMAIVLKLDVKLLKSDDAKIAIAAGTMLLSEYGGKAIDLQKLENVRPIADALYQGIRLGL